MNSKKSFLFYLLLVSFCAHSQMDWCATKEESTFLKSVTSSASQNIPISAFGEAVPLVLKVHFYEVMPSGPDVYPIMESTMLNAIAELNRNFNEFSIFFKYDGVDSFVSDTFYNIDNTEGSTEPSDLDDFLHDNGHFTEGAINIISVNSISNAIAYYRLGGNYVDFTSIVCETNSIDDPQMPYVLTHEVGHNFNLRHTFFEHSTPNPGVFLRENVTRDPLSPNYNALTRGDGIIDTYATPKYYTKDNCIYTDNKVDDTDTPYSEHPPQAKNFMSYAHYCQQEFTAGQGGYMRHYIDLLANNVPSITALILYPESILYEPFRGEYYLAGPNLPESSAPAFQYGFDYVFVDTSQANVYNQPTPYTFTNFWSGAIVESYDINHNAPIIHRNHTAFKILQLDPTPRMCYNNTNRTPKAGTLIKFLDGTLNSNVSITIKDSLQINDPDFIQNLDPGLYNVQKIYNDGTSKETIILKGNN
jgi:hypothetical protein